MVEVDEERADLRTRLKSLRAAVWALFVPVIILGGILSGIFTATESGAMAVIYALFVGLFVYKELKLADLPDIFVRATIITGMVMIVLAAAGIFAWILVTQNLPRIAGDFLMVVTQDAGLILLIIIVFMLFIGMVMEIVAAGIIMIPVLAPIGMAMGFNDVHFGMVLMMTMALGAVTPPVGVTLFVAMGIAGARLSEVNRYIWPMVFVLAGVVILVAYVPEVALFVPRLFGWL